ncbi:MAG: integrase, partial [Synergistaceae bacterium]|nr:integrase [Synergistaceae bacterium]
MKEITAPELLSVLRPIEEKGLVDTARRVRQVFSLVARYGVAIGACDFDVSAALVGALKPHAPKPMATFTKIEDIRRLIQAMREYK